ncbi:uncharacterized protein (DUF2249 family) [Antricoccus suffuscus]|uniref:Uncharacterized protein (DUF2249 family) n=1 Tax=Antricoccus suffuscus TaxID=1629062 RepID=A0A2T1A132_9ACTN|nr:DUF2249 domain-containing protein [Antricoccus suffuscus]PRZ42197.1 uncharacterized protein (DUF2249 family) [Antricoccus suffuscus]
MSNVNITTTESDSTALTAIEQQHAEMTGSLTAHVSALLSAVASGDQSAAQAARTAAVSWSQQNVLAYLDAEEKVLYPVAAAKSEGRLLVEALHADHETIAGLVNELAQAPDGVRAVAAATALRVAMVGHLAKQDQQLLPLLAAAPDVSLSDLHSQLDTAAGLAAETTPAADAHADGHDCTCGETDEKGYPELDARVVPHAIRHATVFGALDAVRPGKGLILVAPHDPLPLLAQLERRSPGAFEVSYVERGPEAWRLAIVRN